MWANSLTKSMYKPFSYITVAYMYFNACECTQHIPCWFKTDVLFPAGNLFFSPFLFYFLHRQATKDGDVCSLVSLVNDFYELLIVLIKTYWKMIIVIRFVRMWFGAYVCFIVDCGLTDFKKKGIECKLFCIDNCEPRD